MAASSLPSTTRYKACLFRIPPSRNDILSENGYAIQVKWERDMARLGGNPSSANTASASSGTQAFPLPLQPTNLSSLAATLDSTLGKGKGFVTSARDPESDPPFAGQSNMDGDSTAGYSQTTIDHHDDQSNACVIELTDYESFWKGRLTKQDWESQCDPTFDISVYEKWTRAAFSGIRHIDGYKVALMARRVSAGMLNLLGTITLAPSVGDRKQLWADWTLNAINERDCYQLQLSSLQKRADNLERLALTSQSLMVNMRQERIDDKSDLLEKVRALINSKKAKIKSLVARNKHLESELEALKAQSVLQIKADIEVDVKQDKGKRRARTPAPKGVADKTPAPSQESAPSSDLGFPSTIPRTLRTTATSRRTRQLNTIMPSPESDPMFSDSVFPDMMPDTTQDPPSDPVDAPYDPSLSIPMPATTISNHLTPASHHSLMDRVSQAVSQSRRRQAAQRDFDISKSVEDEYYEDEDDGDYGQSSSAASENINQSIKREENPPQLTKARDALGGASAASVQMVDPSSPSIAKYKGRVVKRIAQVSVKQEPDLPEIPSNLPVYGDRANPTDGSSDSLLLRKTGSIAATSKSSKSAASKTDSPASSSVLSTTRRLPAIGKRLLSTGGNTSNENDNARLQGDTTTSTFSVSLASLANVSGAYSPDSSMDNSRAAAGSSTGSPAAAGRGVDNQADTTSSGAGIQRSGTKRGSGARSPRLSTDAKRTRLQNAGMQDSLLLPDMDELFKRMQ
ncbi:hypothetical protein BGW41_004864 [Actinomortierella wolfii]|nr:hypothetical protein BGW41_004864 [Actinomortierella wolfii]